jgi:hypothetical protein
MVHARPPSSLRNVVTSQSICEGVIGSGKSSGTTGRVQEVIEFGAPPYKAPREAIKTIKGDDQFNEVNERGECYANVSK